MQCALSTMASSISPVKQSDTTMEQISVLQAVQIPFGMKGDVRSSLSPEKPPSLHTHAVAAKSDSCGSNEQPPSMKWMKTFKALKAYAQQHKHCRPSVSDDSPEVQLLARWAITQRKNYRLFCRGEKSPMTLDKISLLQAIDFPFVVSRGEVSSVFPATHVPSVKAVIRVPAVTTAMPTKPVTPAKTPAPSINSPVPMKHMTDPVQSSWYTMFLRLFAFKKTHGHCCVSSRNPVLKAWLLSQLNDYKAGTLSSCHRKLLRSIGFRFPIRFIDQDDEEDPPERNESPTRPTSAWAPVKKKAKPEPPATGTAKKPTTASITSFTEKLDGEAEKVVKPPPETTIAPAVVRAPPGRMPSAIEVWAGPPDDYLQENGWPPGWIKRVFQRASGKSKGSFDAYWYPPNNGKKLRSMVEVRRHFSLPAVSSGAKTNRQRNEMPSLRAIHAATQTGAARSEPKKRSEKKRPSVQARKRARTVTPKPGTQFTDQDWNLIRSHVPKQYVLMEGSAGVNDL